MSLADSISIVLVDDSQALRKLLSIYLSKQGFVVTLEADNGSQLIAKLAAGMTLPDMCLLDANMPVMDGYETARQLRAHYPSIQIMAFSYLDDKESARQFFDCGAHDFICKEAAAGELVEALRSLHKRAHTGSDLS